MRRLGIGLSIVVAAALVLPAAAGARGPQKNDSVNGHGIILFAPGTTYEFKVSAHAIGPTSTLATGNMYVEAVSMSATGTTTLKIWADVFCVSVLTFQAEVRGHIYRTEPDALVEPTDLVFNVLDAHPFTSSPDQFMATTEAAPTNCVEPPPPTATEPLQKGEITVNDRSPL